MQSTLAGGVSMSGPPNRETAALAGRRIHAFVGLVELQAPSMDLRDGGFLFAPRSLGVAVFDDRLACRTTEVGVHFGKLLGLLLAPEVDFKGCVRMNREHLLAEEFVLFESEGAEDLLGGYFALRVHGVGFVEIGMNAE